MITRKLKESQHQQIFDFLQLLPLSDPLSASREVVMVVDNVCYRLRLQLERHRNLVALQAVMWDQKNPATQELVINNLILTSLLELLIFQTVCGK